MLRGYIVKQSKLLLQFSFSTQKKNKTVGFIGLGNMGGPMSLNLLKKGGYDVIGYDAFEQKREEYKNKGIRVGDSIADIASQCDVVVTMLPNHTHVQSICEGPTGLFNTLPKTGLIIDCSTIAPKAAVSLHESAKKHNIAFVDSPVSGGIGAAAAGTLTFMVGNNKVENFNRSKEYLQHMGKAVIDCKKEGAGQIAKICNNLALAIEMIAVSESMALGSKLGIDSKVLADIINVSSGYCWTSQVYNPCPGIIPTVPSSNGYNGGFASELMLKDLTIAIEAAEQSKSITPMGSVAKKIYSQIVADANNRKDFSIVYQYLLENNINVDGK